MASWYKHKKKEKERNSVKTEIFFRTLKTKILRYITSTSKSVFIFKLPDIVKYYSNTVHSTVKMKPSEANNDTYTEYIPGTKKLKRKFRRI